MVKTTKVFKKKKQHEDAKINQGEHINIDTKYCYHCGEMVCTGDFHKTRSHIYKDGKLPICKKCIGDLINKYVDTYGSIRDALLIICSITNTLVVSEIFEETLKEYSKSRAKKSEMYNHYLLLLDKYIIENSTWTKTNISFECSNFGNKLFKNCLIDDSLSRIMEIDVSSLSQKDSEDEDDGDDDIELTSQQKKKLIKKWGEKDDWDLNWLDQREKSYYETHDIPNDHINKNAVITLCNLELQEFRTLQEGGDVKKILESKSRVLSTTSFSPKKKSKEDATSNALDIGSLIKKREEYAPIINTDPSLDDIDNIRSISSALAGALARTAKIETPLTDEFDRIMKDYTFEFTPNGDEDD